MRASLGRVALIGFLSLGFAGCQMGSPSWSSLAWWRKKPDNSALTEAPKFNPNTTASAGSPALPSAGQNPANSLAGIPSYGAPALAAAPAVGGASASTGGATPASYQSAVYPTTPYAPAKVNATAQNTTNNPSNPASYGTASTAASHTGMAATMPGYGAASQTTAMAAAPTAPSVQPQSGFYNPSYDGGTTNRYVSGAAIPGAMQPAAPATGYAPPTSADTNYRTADLRSAAAAGMAATPSGGAYGNASGGAYGNSSGGAVGNNNAMAQASALVGDRYAGALLESPNGGAAAAPAATDYRSAGSAYPTSNTNYQPGAGVTIPGNTGYTPPDVYSTPAGVNSAPAATTPQEYRPGGTGNYMPTSGSSAQPANNGTGTDGQGAVRPASYQAADAGGLRTASLASATTVVPGRSGGAEVYGSYQGTGSDAAAPAAPSASVPALLPKNGW